MTWIGYIKCDLCDAKIKLDDKIPYNDLNICTSCNKNIIERSKRKYIPEQEKEDPPPKKKKK